ncbi:MAG: orotidine-5'-phosphate decarboxylase [Candidatus Lokiarchaeota archaeon]
MVCLGLDPQIDPEGRKIPRFLIEKYSDHNDIILEFNKSLIDNTADLIPIIKPQIAFYEKYNALEALKTTIEYAHKHDLLVILDAKRNDIGSTSRAYAEAIFENYHADACTLNAYLGSDSIVPFLEFKEKGIFVLIKTSNPSSIEFQDLFSVKLENVPDDVTEIEWRSMPESIKLQRNFLQMANLLNEWGCDLDIYTGYHNLGGVVGATYPIELKKIREILKSSFLLIPGFGFQGGNASDIKFGFDKNGLGGIVNSSRGIMFAYKNNKKYSDEKYDKAARSQIITMNEQINKAINLS